MTDTKPILKISPQRPAKGLPRINFQYEGKKYRLHIQEPDALFISLKDKHGNMQGCTIYNLKKMLPE